MKKNQLMIIIIITIYTLIPSKIYLFNIFAVWNLVKARTCISKNIKVIIQIGLDNYLRNRDFNSPFSFGNSLTNSTT